MALIAMAVWDTNENGRIGYTERTLRSINNTVDFNKHRLVVIDNNSCKETKDLLKDFFAYRSLKETERFYQIITLEQNLGTAAAINRAWNLRFPGENVIKIDNDVVIYKNGWIEDMEAAIRRDSNIGQIGLKRKDCWENPDHEDPHYRSELKFLSHEAGQKWITIEKVNHVMGTCVMHSNLLLNKVGYLYQPKLYGFDDALMSYRSQRAGFYNCFLPHIEIDHIDTGENLYQQWKERHARECWSEYHRLIKGYEDGSIPIYYNPYDSNSNANL